MQPDRYWSKFCKVVGIEALERHPKYKDIEVRRQNSEELVSILDTIFATKPSDEWLRQFDEEGLITAPIRPVSAMVNDPQVIANEYIIEFCDPVYGPTKVVGFPYRLSKTPASVRKPAPALGQHTEEILLELGYTWDEMAKFKDGEVIP